jgi:hypothetical protein
MACIVMFMTDEPWLHMVWAAKALPSQATIGLTFVLSSPMETRTNGVPYQSSESPPSSMAVSTANVVGCPGLCCIHQMLFDCIAKDLSALLPEVLERIPLSSSGLPTVAREAKWHVPSDSVPDREPRRSRIPESRRSCTYDMGIPFACNSLLKSAASLLPSSIPEKVS